MEFGEEVGQRGWRGVCQRDVGGGEAGAVGHLGRVGASEQVAVLSAHWLCVEGDGETFAVSWCSRW